ncbi:MAG: polyphosphate:AMP phosphotransferase [Betaproteobacteria bacterium]|nr:polyphosphate:AMP phosphotransferase [Betaproteobacteria bacterium]
MFESAELKHEIDKKSYQSIVPDLRADLLEAQYRVLEAKRFPVIVLINGFDATGRGETVNLLTTWMDPRHIVAYAFGTPNDEERARPPMWRFWRTLPPKGRIGIFFGNWYTESFNAPFPELSSNKTKKPDPALTTAEINRFERMLVNEGALLLKFWFHLSRKEQGKRLRERTENPQTRWRVGPEEWDHYEHYRECRETAERVLRETNTHEAPWMVVSAFDPRYQIVTVARALMQAMRARLDASMQPDGANAAAGMPQEAVQEAVQEEAAKTSETPSAPRLNVLNTLDLSQRIEKEDYRERLAKYQGKLAQLVRSPEFGARALAVVFEGPDAAGKGGAIRRITGTLDARNYRVVSVAAPSEEEKAQPYLWRFWRHVPPRGKVSIFDRSWYGRVLVERVEGFCTLADWQRAYSEINDFEAQMTNAGIVVVKFWLAICADEQLKRFREREQERFKRFKITAEDWRNREKWSDYEAAACEMVEHTSTDIAPWTLVEANDKYFARITVLKTLCKRLEAALAAGK